MKNWFFIIVAAVFFTFSPRAGLAIENPVSAGRVPPSTIRSGLIRSPNPIDTSSNLVITGNVGGGRHFRGIVPYNSTTDFVAAPGSSLYSSSSLDSFLRRSARSAGYQSYIGRPAPYYSPTRTVTGTRPGYAGVFRPSTAGVGGRAVKKFVLPPLREEKPFFGIGAAEASAGAAKGVLGPVSGVKFRPMSKEMQELERVILSGVKKYPQGGKPKTEQRQAGVEQFRLPLHLTPTPASQEATGVAAGEQPLGLQGLKEQTGEEGSQSQKGVLGAADKRLDVYEQMKLELGGLKEGLLLRSSVDAASDDAELVRRAAFEAGNGAPAKAVPVATQRVQAGQSMDTYVSNRRKEPGGIGKKTSEQNGRALDGLSKDEISAKARAILGEHKSFASFSDDKFNQHMRAGEEYLKQGKYYLAAGAYTLAHVYKPRDPLAYAGKSHALFAAGEYMSSALFLSRALEIFPEYARFKIDLVAMVGSRDKLESRIADVEQWSVDAAPDDAAELQFLLGYVYYQMGRQERAKEAIDAAYEKMADSPAVAALKKAIDESQQPR